MLFKLIAASYVDLKGKKYVKNDTVKSDVRLDEKFKNAFTLIQVDVKSSEAEEVYVAPNIPSPDVVIADTGEVSPTTPNTSPVLDEDEIKVGTPKSSKKHKKEKVDSFSDVTEQFPSANKVSMKVLTDGATYKIVDATDGSVYKKNILTDKKVKSLLKKCSV